MSKEIKHTLKEIRFTGGRFDQTQGWLDLDVLSELQIYGKLLVETAKEEWKRRNPDRKNLPKGFYENFRLGFHEIREGSCAVPVERIVELEDDAIELYVPDELDEAVLIIDETLVAARDDVPFPDRLPSRIIPMFEEWGRTLSPEEGIVLNGNGDDGARFDAAIRDKILDIKRDRYEDVVDLIGEVRAAELKMREGGAFTLLTENGDSIPGVFTNEHESVITEALHEHKDLRVRIIGLGEFEASGQLRRIIRVDQLEEQQAGETPFDPNIRPIWEIIEELGKSVPDEVWDNVPTDLAVNLDHYLYGKAKEDIE